jgi:hypothetical protein
MPIEAEDTTKGLKPIRIGEPLQKFPATVLQHHDFGDCRRQLHHSIEQPARRFAAVEWEGGATGALGHPEK